MAKIQSHPEAFRKPTQRRPRVTSDSHLAFIKSLPCLNCGLPDHSDPHHLKPACEWAAKPSSGTMRPDDSWTVPLCRRCHDNLHDYGNELDWWIWSEPFHVALALWESTGDYERGEEIIRRNR